MTVVNGEKPVDSDVAQSLRALLKAGLELGVSEASRKLQEILPADLKSLAQERWEAALRDANFNEFIESIRVDPSSVLHMVKEVWSRGGPKEKKTAAEALGTALGAIVPHKALAVARDLATMARNSKEADWVGTEAIGPILEKNPAMVDRIKQFFQEHHVFIRRAAIAGVVLLVARKRKYAALGIEVLLEVADQHEKEIREAVRWAAREVGRVDPKASAGAIIAWVKAAPTRERAQAALHIFSNSADTALQGIQKVLYANLARFADGGEARAKAPEVKPKPRKARSAR